MMIFFVNKYVFKFYIIFVFIFFQIYFYLIFILFKPKIVEREEERMPPVLPSTGSEIFISNLKWMAKMLSWTSNGLENLFGRYRRGTLEYSRKVRWGGKGRQGEGKGRILNSKQKESNGPYLPPSPHLTLLLMYTHLKEQKLPFQVNTPPILSLSLSHTHKHISTPISSSCLPLISLLLLSLFLILYAAASLKEGIDINEEALLWQKRHNKGSLV